MLAALCPSGSCWFDRAGAFSTGGAAPTKSLMHNYWKTCLGPGQPVCAPCRGQSPRQHRMSHPIPATGPQQRPPQHSKPKRNTRCSGLTVGAERDVFRMEGLTQHASSTGNKLGDEVDAGECGSWGIPLVPLLRHLPPCSAACSEPSAGRLCPQSFPPMEQHRESSMGMAWSWSLFLLAGQHRVTGLVAALWICSRANPPPLVPIHHPAPVLRPQLSSCLVPALTRSFALRVRKETARCQSSYLRGNKSIELY